MAEDTPPPDEQLPVEPEAVEAVTSGDKSSLFGKIKLLLIVFGIIAVECLVAKLYLPDAADLAAMARGQTVDDANDGALMENEEVDEIKADQLEVDMGEFHVTAFQPRTNTTLIVDFHLWGAVHEDDEADFAKLLEAKRRRFEDQVIFIIRSSEVADLTDPGWGLLKRKVREKTNRILGRPFLKAVFFNEFSHSVH